jgi:hypothetical protein
MHPHNPDCAYVIPVDSEDFRCSRDGRLRVYRTRNAGNSWEALSRGLPQKQAYETVLRDAMTTDSLDPAGIFFGTRSGQLFGSSDEGKSWRKILDGLPSIVCVRAALVDGVSRPSADVSFSEPSTRPYSTKSGGPRNSRRVGPPKTKSGKTKAR